MAIDYLKLFGDDFDTVLKALDDLTPAAEKVLLNSLDNMVFDAQTFSTNIEKQISSMTSSGMSRGAVASSLNNDMKTGGRIFGALRNSVKSGIVEGVQETAKLGQYDNYDLDKGNFAWVTVGGHKVCADCDGRAGDVGTFNYHETEGLPGAGWSVCQAYCYCVLDPTGKLPKKVQGVPVKEKGASARKGPKVKRITEAQAGTLARKFVGMAQKADVALTGVIEGMAEQVGARMHGLKYRIKDFKSTTRKIIANNVEDGVSYARMAKEDLSDINRYTYILKNESYVDDFYTIVRGIEAEGYELAKIKNYWDGDLYKGMNCNFKTLDGRKFEIQFNTQTQQYVKDKFSHKWYEEFREISTAPARKDQLEILLTEKWNAVSAPSGAIEIPNFP